MMKLIGCMEQTSAMAAAASALSLVKRERGPVIQVAGSSSTNNHNDNNGKSLFLMFFVFLNTKVD